MAGGIRHSYGLDLDLHHTDIYVGRILSRKQIQQTLIGVVLLGALYWYFSPQQNCIRDGSAGLSVVEGKVAAEAVQAEKLQIIEECGESNAW